MRVELLWVQSKNLCFQCPSTPDVQLFARFLGFFYHLRTPNGTRKMTMQIFYTCVTVFAWKVQKCARLCEFGSSFRSLLVICRRNRMLSLCILYCRGRGKCYCFERPNHRKIIWFARLFVVSLSIFHTCTHNHAKVCQNSWKLFSFSRCLQRNLQSHEAMQKCAVLMKLDYEVVEISNACGELSSNYPSTILVPENEKLSNGQSNGQGHGNAVSVTAQKQQPSTIYENTSDSKKLREVIFNARYAR